jgi:hypothetical protein
MGQVHHGGATTTAAIRRAIQQSQAGLRALVWTPPALQALSSSFRHRRVSCCHVSGLQYGHMAAGLDEIRGSAPDYQVELEALWFSRALPTHGPTVVPSR